MRILLFRASPLLHYFALALLLRSQQAFLTLHLLGEYCRSGAEGQRPADHIAANSRTHGERAADFQRVHSRNFGREAAPQRRAFAFAKGKNKH